MNMKKKKNIIGPLKNSHHFCRECDAFSQLFSDLNAHLQMRSSPMNSNVKIMAFEFHSITNDTMMTLSLINYRTMTQIVYPLAVCVFDMFGLVLLLYN